FDGSKAGALYSPQTIPAEWRVEGRRIWRFYNPPNAETPDTGWKVHVSTVFERVEETLDTVASYCFERGIPFKSISGPSAFLLT
ncbi:class III lanthionine synthetase LanKC N-terminal domain-containing protein, partial [Escherichia coli]|uniref:class III lanthionine synthetase LanKC N-terminal domain-containing protein n=1 Tax=Escherichia coli TaxID=562 RepID=UPI001CC3BD72